MSSLNTSLSARALTVINASRFLGIEIFYAINNDIS